MFQGLVAIGPELSGANTNLTEVPPTHNPGETGCPGGRAVRKTAWVSGCARVAVKGDANASQRP